jgi:hypothetical protein
MEAAMVLMSPIAYHAQEPPRMNRMVAITRPSGLLPFSQPSRIKVDKTSALP